MDDEKTRAAANMAVTLSTQLMSGGFTMLTVLAAFATFFFEKRQPGGLFVILAAIAFVSFILATIIGGKAIAALYRAVANGTWSPDNSKAHFSSQAVFTLVGLTAFCLSLVFHGAGADSRTDAKLDSLLVAEARDRAVLERLSKDRDEIARRVDSTMKTLSEQSKDQKKGKGQRVKPH